MKLVSYRVDGADGFGAVVGAGIVSLSDRLGLSDIRELLARDLTAVAREVSGLEADLPLSAVQLLPPVPRPNKILGVGLNYRDHVAETDMKAMPYPTLFIRFPDSVVGAGQAIRRPRISEALDFEGEMAIVIGKPGRYIPAADALDHVAGYSCFNDASIRDWQFHTTQVIPGKNFPNVGSFGPWIVTADEAPQIADMHITTRLNGEAMQDASLADLIFSVADMIAYCSSFTELGPGDVIATGSPAGIGNRRNPKVFMKPGDTIEVEIRGIGTLRNPVEEE